MAAVFLLRFVLLIIWLSFEICLHAMIRDDVVDVDWCAMGDFFGVFHCLGRRWMPKRTDGWVHERALAHTNTFSAV